MSVTTNISVYRGATTAVVVALSYESGVPYMLEPGEQLVLAVKRDLQQEDPDVTVYATVDDYSEEDGGYVFEFDPGDTYDLIFGNYYYDVGLVDLEGSFQIVVPCSYFVVKPTIASKEYATTT